MECSDEKNVITTAAQETVNHYADRFWFIYFYVVTTTFDKFLGAHNSRGIFGWMENIPAVDNDKSWPLCCHRRPHKLLSLQLVSSVFLCATSSGGEGITIPFIFRQNYALIKLAQSSSLLLRHVPDEVTLGLREERKDFIIFSTK